mgnify:CR=1 FL=1
MYMHSGGQYNPGPTEYTKKLSSYLISNGIDIIAREQVMNTITGYNSEDKIIIVSSHLVDELEHAAGGAVFIKDGRVVMAGNTEDIRSYNDNKSLVDLYKEIYGGMYNGQTY